MLLLWDRVGIALPIVECAMLTPLATKPPAAFTILIPEALASTLPASVTL
jgi:hypothetical protein